MRTVRTHTDAWTYYDFGARSPNDEIRALVFDHFDQSPDGGAIGSELREQSARSAFPVITVGSHTVPLGPKTSNSVGVSGVAKLVLPVDLDIYGEAVAYLSQRPELLTKLQETVARHVAQRVMEMLLYAIFQKDRITLETPDRQVLYAASPDR